MKKIYFAILMVLSLPVFAKEVKQPDSYAYNRGLEAYQAQNYAEALDWFNKEIAENPNNGYAYTYIALINLDNNDFGTGLANLDRALSKLPKKDKEFTSRAYALRSAVFSNTGDTVKALEDLGTAIKLNDKNEEIYKIRGQIYYEQGKYDLSDKDYNRMVELDKGNYVGYLGLARNQQMRGNYDEAIKQYTYITKMWPDYSYPYSFRADAYMDMEKWNEATDDIVTALVIDGNDSAYSLISYLPEDALDLLSSKLKVQMAKDPQEPYWPFTIAMIAKSNDQWDDVIKYMQKALQVSNNPLIYKQLAIAYYNSGDENKALEYANRYLEQEENYEIISLTADILANRGKLEEALEMRNRNVLLYPEYPWVYFERGLDLMEDKNFKDAVDDFNQAQALGSYFEEWPSFLIKRGDAYAFTGNKAKAEADYKKLIEIEKDNQNWGDLWSPFALTGLGENEKALELMNLIVEKDPEDNAGNLYNLACIYCRIGDNEKALETLEKAILAGYDNYYHVINDYDMVNLVNLPEFQKMVQPLKPDNTARGVVNQEAPVSMEVTKTVEIPFTREEGVTKVKCTINGLPLYFIFDTGAAEVSISSVEATFMLKNGYIKPSDIIGKARYMDANGDISEGTVINLKKVDFGGVELENVRASVVSNQNAPLLLGQSVLSRLGKIEIDNKNHKLVINPTR